MLMAWCIQSYLALATISSNKPQVNRHLVNISNIKPRVDINGEVMDIHGTKVLGVWPC